jgi:hypothetical protein
LFAVVSGRIKRIKSAANKASTPPSLFGIDRRIAYTHKKYHSGLMWTGVTRGLASKKFSGSVNKLGAKRTIDINRVNAIMYPKASLVE